MKLKKCALKLSFVLIMLMSILTIFMMIKNTYVKAETTQTDYVANSLMDFVVNNNLPDGDYNVTVVGVNSSGESETIIYPVELINYYDDVTYTTSDANSSGYVELGDETNKKKMLIVKYHGNLTIESGVTLTSNTYTTTISGTNYELTYKKGMYINVAGTLTNNGTISMTARGTYNLVGENVYLFNNEDGTYEYIPATGGTGGAAKSESDGSNAGVAGSNRSTGGGGSGGRYSYFTTSGKGGTGTSYSGGTGGGGAAYGYGVGTAGSSIGGSGGKGVTDGSGNNNLVMYGAGGGAGNPGGIGTAAQGSTGTGGLLIINTDQYINNGMIRANGTTGGNAAAGGGSSGGGSINIFMNNDTGIDQLGIITNTRYTEILRDVTASGGAATGTSIVGGKGGNGVVSIGQIRDGQYYDLKEAIEQDKEEYSNQSEFLGDSIISILMNSNLNTGYYTFVVNGVSYPVHYISYDGDQIWSENKTFGDANDVATSSTYAQNMIVVKINGNLTIDSGVTVTTYSSTYGGPKGLTLYVTGTLTNNGTITMTAKGAKATGQNVYLWKNPDGTYEYVPATGGAGGTKKTGANGANAGSAGSNRQTGGGGSGARYHGSSTSGAGGAGTSYSGGAGGGAGTYGSVTGGTGSSVGAAGGNAKTSVSASATTYSGGGGAGNPGGTGVTNNGGKGNQGTGGLLNIYAENYVNNGTISSNGSNGGSGAAGGGSSGGGSINIFINNDLGINQTGIITDTKYKEILKSVTATGGSAVGTTVTGGKGGNGVVSIGQIRNGQYYDLKEAINQDKEEFTNSVTIEGESILKILEENDLQTGYYNFSVNNQKYPVNLIVYDEDQVWSSNKTFGNSIDVATSSTYAQNMVIVKVNGNLTINSGVTVTAYSGTYGGPKGLTLYVTGSLENNGTITMSAKGAKATGQNVYLWKNLDGTYEYVPATGGAGGAAKSGANGANAGTAGSNRKTGGGGSGGRNYGSSTSGAGGSGTSYSGGAGGGAGTYGSAAGTAGSSVGGAGGNAKAGTTSSTYNGGGGAGNPGGSGVNSGGTKGSNGTGGLLTIYADSYTNNGSITSAGTTGGKSYAGGGSSGGGSINIFSYAIVSKGAASATGGAAVGTTTAGGKGGNGTVTYTTLQRTPYLIDLKVNDETIDNFYYETTEYEITLNKYDVSYDITATASTKDTIIVGLGKYNIETGETKTTNIALTNASGYTNLYTLTINNPEVDEHNSKLKSLIIDGYEKYLEPDFHPLTTEYDVEIYDIESYLDITANPYDEEATIKIQGNGFIKDINGTITIIVSEPNSEDTIYIINYIKTKKLEIYDYSYTGDVQEFIVPHTGQYKVELWGASGGFSSNSDVKGRGAYTSGNIKLNKNELLYIYVGEQGSNSEKNSFNGGGRGGNTNYATSTSNLGNSGGGATDIRLIKGTTWKDFESLKSRIMVAGGSGGAAGNTQYETSGGYSAAGGLTGYDGGYYSGHTYVNQNGKGATQTSGGLKGNNHFDATGTVESGSFGVGGNNESYSDDIGAGGGGGGYYGGGAGGGTLSLGFGQGAGGGSSYISGHEGSNSIDEASTEDNIIHTGKSIHYSNYVFTDTMMVDGLGYSWTTQKATKTGMPTYDASSIMTGNTGNGYAKITPILLSKDNYLISIVTDKGELNPVFDPTVEEYNIELTENDTKIKISARPSSDLATIEGLGEHAVPSGTTTFPIVVTAESGETRTYNINVTRPSSDDSKAKNIEITGLVPSICEGHIGYCELDTEFDPYKGKYYITVPAGIRELEFTVIKNHDYQTVTGDGVTRLKGGDNEVTLEVISEDGQSITTYSYEIYRDMTGNNYIDKLEIINPKIDIGFDYLISEYTFKVENSVTSLEMNIELDDPNATYEVIGNENFVVGNNIVEVEVTAANGEIRNYILNVYRVSNSNALLSNLEVTNGDIVYQLSPEFEDIKTNYTVNVENEVNKVQVNATAQADTTTISGTGSYDLKTGLNQIKVMTTAENGDVETYTIIITRAKNSNNYLSSLSFTEGTLNETFDKEVNSYTTTVDPYTKSLTITATPEVSTSSVSISGNSNFKIGENLVTIKVTSEDSSIRNYYITVTKEGSDNNYLSSLTVNKGTLSPTFNKETLLYNVEVENEISAITISGEKEDTLSKVNGFGTYVLTSGENTITVRVTSETGITRDYVINVFRKLNADATLRNITLSSGELNPTFDKDTLEYTVNVENEVEKITIRGIPNVNTTTVEGNNTYTLSVGSNQIELNTTSENGIKLTYKINVIRNQSSNANLSYLMVKEGIMNPTFDKNTVNYTVKVLNETENITVEYFTEKETSSVVVTGTDNLQVGENEVNVIVTSEDGTVKTYYLTVIRLDESLSNLNLKTLDVTSCTLNPEFSPSIGYYECEVEYETSSVTVSAQMEDETNTLSGTGKHNLSVGQNVIGVSVSNDLGIEKGYNVVITRKESEEVRLKNISVKNHVLNETYNPDIFEYTLTTEEDSLEFVIEKMHEDQVVEIVGNENFELGINEVQIRVTNAAKTKVGMYTIYVTKEKSTNNYFK